MSSLVFLCVVFTHICFTLLHHLSLALVIKMHAGFTHYPDVLVGQ